MPPTFFWPACRTPIPHLANKKEASEQKHPDALEKEGTTLPIFNGTMVQPPITELF
jgi:hypothetical protein